TAAARVRLSQSCPPAQLDQGKEKVRYLSQRLEALEQDQAKGLAASAVLQQQFRETQADTEQRNAALQQAWQQEKELVSKLDGSPASRDALYALQGETPLVYPEVTATTVAEVIADWTGIPLGRMQCDELTVLQNLESHLAQRVTGQESALGRLAQSLRTARSGLRKSEAPLGVFLLAGPSGVGKTETARALAENLFGGERSLITINMSEYQEAHTVSQLKGSPPGYVGYGEGGVLSEAVRQRPYSVVLLDEVEKAHPDVMNLFYQVFDRGMLRDGEGREIDFRNTVILMTSNLGSDILMQEAAPQEANESLETEQQGGDDTTSNEQGEWLAPTDSQLIDAITPALRQHFAAALLARMLVIPFRPLDEQALATVVAMRLEAVAERLQQAHDMTFRVDRQVVDLLTRQCQVAENGARQVEAMIEQQLLPGLSRQLLGYMAEDNLPDILTLTLSDDGEIDAIFSDRNIPEEDALSA
ncbi:MAG: AAA family ATPase, partial [Alcanivorax nanhaiticus]